MQLEDSWVLRTLMENTADSIYIKDRQCRLWKVSRKMAADLGYSNPEDIYGKTDIELFGEDFGKQTMEDDLEVMQSGKTKTGIVEKYLNSHGEYNWTFSTKLPLRNDQGEVVGLLGITREINDLKSADHEYQWLATHDPLTSLLNRYLLMDRIHQAISLANRTGESFAVLFIDLNEFKKINDLQGHDQGDKYLVQTANELSKNLRVSDTIARYGGDEFIVVLNEVHDFNEAELVAHKLTELVYDCVDPINHSITVSIGISLYPKDGTDVETLLKVADRSMYEVKRQSSSTNQF